MPCATSSTPASAAAADPGYTAPTARNTPVTKPKEKAPKQKPIWERIMELGDQIPEEPRLTARVFEE